MTESFTVVFRALEEQADDALPVSEMIELEECATITELARFAEALQEPELTSYLVG